jgi:hypothetical protein
MKTRVFNLGQTYLSLVFCLGLAACNKSDYYQKAYLQNPNSSLTTTGSVNGGQAGVDSGVSGGTQGGVSSGVNGGTTGSTTSGSSTVGGTVGGDGSTTGGTTSGDGSTTGGTTTEGSTTGGTTTGGTTTGGTTTGGTTTGGTTTGGTTTGGTTTGGTTTGGTTTGGTTTGGTSTGGTTGVVYQDVTENFQQSQSSQKLDVLWVIDNSGSMETAQSDLSANLSSFIQQFITLNIDFKMAMTTTDTSSAAKKGRTVPGSDTKLNAAQAQANPQQFIHDFESLALVGINGSGNEKGLEGAEGFLQKSANTFLRPDAYLAIVIISDEEDQSPKAPKDYTDYYKSFKSQPGLVKVYTIVDVTLSNQYRAGNGITVGFQRYADASNFTGGTVGDIRGDFAQTLSGMSNSIVKLLDSFPLANTPVAGTLKVYVNDQLDTNYTYDSTSRAIKFDANHLPPVGATIKVTYSK